MNPFSALPCRLLARASSASLLLLGGTVLATPTLKWSSSVDTGGAISDRAKAVGMTSGGDVIAAFQIGSGTGAQIRVRRLAAGTGMELWTRDVGTAGVADDVAAIAVDPVSGNTFVAARTASAINGLDWLVFKINGSNGSLGWAGSHTFSTSGNDQPRAITFTPDGNIVVAGMETNPVNGSSRLRVTKINAVSGAQIWNYTNATDSTDALALTSDASGNVIAVGGNGANAFVVSLSSTGTNNWSQTYNGAGNGHDAWTAVTLLSNGDLAVAGHIMGASGGQNFAAARYAAAGGSPLWTREINGSANADDAAFDITSDASDNLYAVGLLRDISNGQTAHIAKLAAGNGVVTWSSSKNGNNSNAEATDAFFAVRVLGGDVLAAGTQADVTNRSNILVSRFSVAGVFKDDTVFDGPAHGHDLLLSKNLLTTNGTTSFAIGGDSENAKTSSAVSDAEVRVYFVPTVPIVVSPTTAGLTSTSATLGGNVTGDGGVAINARGVVFAQTVTNNNPQLGGLGVTNVTSSGTSGIFAVSASNLTAGTSYSFKAYATNSLGTGYSNAGSFTTLTVLENWRQTWYGTPGNTGNAADTADPYHTGVQNLLAFAFFGPTQDPALVKIHLLPQIQLTGGNLFYSFTRPSGVSGITYAAESSTTLLPGSWQAIPNTGTSPQFLFSMPASAPPATRRFLRLKVSNP